LQLICVDGASHDQTVDCIKKYGALVSQLVVESDTGPASAINKGLSLADGEVVCWLNSDDELKENSLSYVGDFFQKNPDVDVLSGGCTRMFVDGTQIDTAVPQNFLRVVALRNDIEQPSTFWRLSLHRKLGKLDEDFAFAFDWEWWNRLALARARWALTPEVLSIYHFSDYNLTSNAGIRVVNEMYKITKKYDSFLIAILYKLIFKIFDMRGFYDNPFHQLSLNRRLFLGSFLNIAYIFFTKERVNSYNWNWASRQIRGDKFWFK
jgi:glycosyltransferase involved in cell wall biosynthesis